MSKPSKLNRKRVPTPAPRSRRIAPTFPLILSGLLGLSALRALPVLPTLPTPSIFNDCFGTSRLYAQTPGNFNDGAPFERTERFARSPQTAQIPQTAANAPTSSAPNQVVFFSIPVAVDVADVRSGPSDDAYSTGGVGKNRYVEAYFRAPNGWCAIRPPQGSFSWVNAKFVRRESNSTGRIVASNGKAVPARVGAATVEESAIVQVGLKNGRQINILGEARLSDGSTWLKIAPPSGEFRWIRSSDLIAAPALAQLPTKLTFQREFLESLAQTPNGANLTAAPALENAADSAQLSQNAQLSQSAQSARPESFNAALPPQVDDAEPLPDAVVASASRQGFASEPSQLPQPAETAPAPVSEEDAFRFKMEIARLNADVFQALRQNPPSNEELALLASRAETLFDAAPTDGERFVVQSIYDAIKIAERRNRSQFNGANGTPVGSASPVFPNAPAPSNPPVPPNSFGSRQFPNRNAASEFNDVNRFGEFQSEEEPPLLLLPDGNFEPIDETRSGATWLNGDGTVLPNAAQFANSPRFTDSAFPTNPNVSPQLAGFNQQGLAFDVFAPSASSSLTPNGFNSALNSSSNVVGTDAAPTEKRPRLAFAFSSANTPFRSRSSKGKDVRVAPLDSSNAEKVRDVPRLPSLLPPQKQLIVPPPNYRSGPFGQNDRANKRTVAASRQSATSAQDASVKQEKANAQALPTTQEITVDNVRWRAVDASKVSPDVAASISRAPSGGSEIVFAAAEVASETKKVAQASSTGSTARSQTTVLTGATVPANGKNAATNAQSNKFQPISSRSSGAFDASGLLAKLPKAPKGAPQYALTRPVGDRFEIVSYLETENGVALEPYVGRKIGVKGTLGTIQIGEKTQTITTVRTIFEQD